jgi:hypothetical protein
MAAKIFPEVASSAAQNLKEIVFTSSNANWTIPTGVTGFWALCVGSGGGGGMGSAGSGSSSGPLNSVTSNIGGSIAPTKVGVTGSYGASQGVPQHGGFGINVFGYSVCGGGSGSPSVGTSIAASFGAGVITTNNTAGSNATENTGAGGNSGKTTTSTAYAGGNGGSGLVILQYVG